MVGERTPFNLKEPIQTSHHVIPSQTVNKPQNKVPDRSLNINNIKGQKRIFNETKKPVERVRRSNPYWDQMMKKPEQPRFSHFNAKKNQQSPVSDKAGKTADGHFSARTAGSPFNAKSAFNKVCLLYLFLLI